MRKLIKIENTGDMNTIRVVSKEGKGELYLFGALQNPLRDTVRDGDNIMSYAQFYGMDHLTFWWLRDSYGKITGRKEYVFLPEGTFYKALAEGGKLLASDEDRTRPRIVYCGRKTLKNVAANKVVRKKFGRFLRDHFDWRGAKEIRLYDDGKYSFYFEEELIEGGRGICGGIIFHEGETLKDSNYSMHT